MLPLLYLDDHLVAIDKPPGLLVHRTGLDAGETQFALQLLRDQLGRPVWPVHRLDKGTSGVLLFALDSDTARRLGAMFMDHGSGAEDANTEDGSASGGVHKTYQAIVRGWPPLEGLIDHPLKRLDDDLRPGRTEVQAAQTRYRTLARYELPLPNQHFATLRCALVALTPLTGRRHQLRRHLKHLAHPIMGDATYGKGPLNRGVAVLLGQQRLWLHAQRLTLRHPVNGAELRIESGPSHWPSDCARWTPYALAA